MQPEQFEWESGEVVFWDLGFLDPDKSLLSQLDDLKEDLVQVRYGNAVLDVGWYPEFSDEGEFVVRIVSEGNWEEPLFQESSNNAEGLVRCLKEAIAVVEHAVLMIDSGQKMT